ncbi:MAG: hypothetical protein CK425_05565 [Parachlamydia sp.]|nr:MAG: hypothetical protein CK425_05565 [Parachlamydia sp.]
MSTIIRRPRVQIGTAGWSYPDWKENFYPDGLKTKEWLNYYSANFATVEVNTTFYHLPLQSTVNNWLNQVPESFLFSIKASRYITHQKKLKECKESLALFYKVMQELHPKMGPILFQLPPSFQMNKERLEDFLLHLKEDFLHVFEFRHPSWFVDEIYEILAKKNIGLCMTDLNGKQSPEEITSFFTYIRLHGPHQAYQESYGAAKLKSWKKKIEKWKTKTSVYCYFDNDAKGAAIEDAKVMRDFFRDV